MNHQKPVGVLIFSAVLIVTSLLLLSWLPGYGLYAQVNHEWPDWAIRIRYLGSYLYRLIGLFCGIGILMRSHRFRKILLALSWYSLVTLPLRHTYSSQLFFSEPIYHQQGSMFSLETFTWMAVVIHWLIDGIFSLSVIIYFKRPKVIQWFIKENV